MGSRTRTQSTSKSRAGRALAARRAEVSDLLNAIQPLSARSVLATALLGADQPHLRVGELISSASLFGIGAGATRTCLSRMVASGELTTKDATYALTGSLLERWRRIDDLARREESSARRWDGTWELAVVWLDRRAATDRLVLRKAAAALHLAEIREGVWTRPNNLDPARLPAARAVLEEQCALFRGARSDLASEAVASLFGLGGWSGIATRLVQAMADELETEAIDEHELQATLTHHFALSIAVVRHLQVDPLLPASLLPKDWPTANLRGTYRRFDAAFKQRMHLALRRTGA